jgi:peptidyl-dipeptidase Dcp
MKKLGLIINPIAGMGGRVGLKGTDGADILAQAESLGAKPRANRRAIESLNELVILKNEVELITCPNQMGRDALVHCGFKPKIIDSVSTGCTSAIDTTNAAKTMLDMGADLILFAGGDGTARDMYSAVKDSQVVLGIPAGVKIHSVVYACNPQIAGKLASLFLQGKTRRTVDCEIKTIRTNKMKQTVYLLAMAILTIGCSVRPENTLLQQWKTPFQTPPFEEIKDEHFMPAFLEAMAIEKAEVEAIANNKKKPTFKNTIEAMEESGKLHDRISRVFYALNDAETNDQLQDILKKVTPLQAKHSDDINLNKALFARIKQIYEKKESLALTPEQDTLLENYFLRFVRSGANLNDEDKDELRKINEELSNLYVKFQKNHLKETNAIALVIEKEENLAGLPDEVVQGAAEMAKARGMEGKWVFTLQKPSFIPFLMSSEKRQLREIVFKAYINRCNNNDEFDNKKLIARIAALRVARANLLGYKNHADFVLERNMAKKPEAVYRFLYDLWKPAVKRAMMEIADMQAIIDKEGHDFKLKAWDWWYYSEKVKKEKYALDEAMLRPYFKMENVRKGAFDVAEKLYGIRFVKRTDIQVYHPDVEVFEVLEADGTHLGIFYSDYYPRDGKSSGAWSGTFRSQSDIEGNFITPLNYNVGNFAKPTADKPSLMSMDEVLTLFHELGHGLNSLFANTVYSGSRRVPSDFVELPSQIMENWASDPAVLKTYAFHYETGKPIPQEIIDKLEKSKHFNQGFMMVEYLAASFLDMDWHILTDTSEPDAAELEKASLEKIGLMSEIESRYQSTNFGHIFASGGYSSGYYSYIWAAVLDADAFQAFKETDLFNKELAASFRKNVLSKGSNDTMAQYVKFRGAEPKVDALLKKRGLD